MRELRFDSAECATELAKKEFQKDINHLLEQDEYSVQNNMGHTTELCLNLETLEAAMRTLTEPQLGSDHVAGTIEDKHIEPISLEELFEKLVTKVSASEDALQKEQTLLGTFKEMIMQRRLSGAATSRYTYVINKVYSDFDFDIFRYYARCMAWFANTPYTKSSNDLIRRLQDDIRCSKDVARLFVEWFLPVQAIALSAKRNCEELLTQYHLHNTGEYHYYRIDDELRECDPDIYKIIVEYYHRVSEQLAKHTIYGKYIMIWVSLHQFYNIDYIDVMKMLNEAFEVREESFNV